jgi:hypothetical protein
VAPPLPTAPLADSLSPGAGQPVVWLIPHSPSQLPRGLRPLAPGGLAVRPCPCGHARAGRTQPRASHVQRSRPLAHDAPSPRALAGSPPQLCAHPLPRSRSPVLPCVLALSRTSWSRAHGLPLRQGQAILHSSCAAAPPPPSSEEQEPSQIRPSPAPTGQSLSLSLAPSLARSVLL